VYLPCHLRLGSAAHLAGCFNQSQSGNTDWQRKHYLSQHQCTGQQEFQMHLCVVQELLLKFWCGRRFPIKQSENRWNSRILAVRDVTFAGWVVWTFRGLVPSSSRVRWTIFFLGILTNEDKGSTFPQNITTDCSITSQQREILTYTTVNTSYHLLEFV